MEIKKMYAKTRNDSSKSTRNKIRQDGLVPSVLYGGGKSENVVLALDEKTWGKLFDEHSYKNLVLDLIIDNKEDSPELIKVGEVQRHTLTERLVHIDLIRLQRGVATEFEVPIHLLGRSEGQKEGGVLTQFIDSLKVECFPRDVPDSIAVEMANFKIGDKFHVADLKWDNPNVKMLAEKDQTIFSIEIPKIKTKAEEEAEAAAAAAAAAEAEAEKEEGEEKAEKPEKEKSEKERPEKEKPEREKPRR